MLDLQHLRAEYVRHLAKGGERVRLEWKNSEWSPDVIHISELGACERSVMLHLVGAQKRIRSQSETDNNDIMYHLSYELHYLTYESLQWKGRLVEYESPCLPVSECTGRIDAFYMDDDGALVQLDVKSMRSNAFKDPWVAELPKEEHVLQHGGYLLGAIPGRVPDRVVIDYVDRGGSNSDVICIVNQDDAKWRAQRKIDRLVQLREALPELPDECPPEAKEHRKRITKAQKEAGEKGTLTSLGVKRSWKCGYCDYLGTACAPSLDDSEILVAVAPNNPYEWEITQEAKANDTYLNLVLSYLKKELVDFSVR